MSEIATKVIDIDLATRKMLMDILRKFKQLDREYTLIQQTLINSNHGEGKWTINEDCSKLIKVEESKIIRPEKTILPGISPVIIPGDK